MRQDYSRTAEGMAVLRALEQQQPAARRILNDPYAKEFIFNPAFRLLISVPWHAWGVSFLLKFWAPGGQELLTIRARLVDEFAVEQARQGVRQIVLLGAGLFAFLLYRSARDLNRERAAFALVFAAFAFVLVGEAIGRYLFYVTSVKIGL